MMVKITRFTRQLSTQVINLRSPRDRYNKLVKKGEIVQDLHQVAALYHLDALFEALISSKYSPPNRPNTNGVENGHKIETNFKDIGEKFCSVSLDITKKLFGARTNVKVSSFRAPVYDTNHHELKRHISATYTILSSRLFSLFGIMLGSRDDAQSLNDSISFISSEISINPPSHAPKGLYIHGGVGTGKTYLMDIFYESLPETMAKRRVHFNKFMLDVHSRLHALRVDPISKQRMCGVEVGSPQEAVDIVVHDLMKEGWLLCFDEFQVTDIADAMLMRQLFSKLIEKGAVIVATSNRPPDDLYYRGLQRASFMPFIDLLKHYITVHSMTESATDYRLLKYEKIALNAYFIQEENDVSQKLLFEKVFQEACGGHSVNSINTLKTQHGERQVHIPRACLERQVAYFTFEELCLKAVGAADYLKIAEVFHTVFLENMPQMTLKDINQLRRLIVLVDTFYDQKVKLVILASAAPSQLLKMKQRHHHASSKEGTSDGGEEMILSAKKEEEDMKEEEGGNEDEIYLRATFDELYSHDMAKRIDEIFAFDRTVIRLLEMQSTAYLEEVEALRWKEK